ncbi:MAG: undecaprenyl/decaprenyl-phosphate alpha-N-acetylglucosaminyl 1-phosphate transferase [Pirellulales bacterium]|nr:undecaprenyl/decaprenyl-phosphate alpha-N-acetylglucosaminyl 1-phosphate transferase [Pirellulales bacterium]
MALAALAAFLTSLLLTPLVAIAAWKAGAVSHPDGARRLQAKPVPLWGGFAVLVGMIAGTGAAWAAGLIAGEAARFSAALMLSAGTICLLGCYDDCREISAAAKLLGQLVAVLPLVLAGFYAERLLLFGYEIELGWLGVPVTMAWFALAVNALNLLDGMDGLASLTGIVISIGIAVISAALGSQVATAPALLLAAALTGFLVHNFPPARIYLGDAGSLLVGLLLAAMAMRSSAGEATTMNGSVASILLLLPLADTSLAVVRRLLRKQSVFQGDRGHVHHRLLDRGFSTAQALAVLGGLSLANGGLAWFAAVSGREPLAWSTVAAGLPLLIYARLLAHEEWALVRRALPAPALWTLPSASDTPLAEEKIVALPIEIGSGARPSPVLEPHFRREPLPVAEGDGNSQEAESTRTRRKRTILPVATRSSKQRRRAA